MESVTAGKWQIKISNDEVKSTIVHITLLYFYVGFRKIFIKIFIKSLDLEFAPSGMLCIEQ